MHRRRGKNQQRLVTAKQGSPCVGTKGCPCRDDALYRTPDGYMCGNHYYQYRMGS